jgi:uncharacterized protein YuzE
MRYRYDPEADALSIVLRETTVLAKHLAGGIAIEYDKDGRLAGIEIPAATQKLGADVLRSLAPESAIPASLEVREKPPSSYGRPLLVIVSEPIPLSVLLEMAKENYGNIVKAVVDIEKGMMALNADLHSDEESALLAQGSRQEDLWGINIHPERPFSERIEFDSMVNVRPGQGNRTRGIDDPEVRRRILEISVRMIIE